MTVFHAQLQQLFLTERFCNLARGIGDVGAGGISERIAVLGLFNVLGSIVMDNDRKVI